ncbi:hypothetical protein EG329_004690 [Mollisiaceae sp. DMI_Dod_QoI]|nr:hypothetical protein EG329_004690 [Helotiales sp. DMI_Dod_QoI]
MSRKAGPESEGLQAMPNDNPPEAVFHDNTSPVYTNSPPQTQQWAATPNKEYVSGSTNQYSSPTNGRTPGTILGLRKSTLILSLLFLVATIVAIVVGAVLGTRSTSSSCPTPISTAAGNQTSCSNSTATTTTTGAFVAPTGITVALDCPNLNGQTINENYLPTSTFFKYQVTCGQDCQGHDISANWAYSLDMCVESCVSFTHNNYTGITCGSVAFRPDMANVTGLGGNCYLKQGDCVPVSQNVQIAHAVLMSLPF